MQFKYPEIFYFLFILLIPILIHLFQLQKFVKVPFTNVAFLKQVIQETRKSSQLKKWLILATRLLCFLAILFTFSQPYFSSKKENQKQENFIYLDNSLSTKAKGEKGELLQNTALEIIENASSNDTYNLLTNDYFDSNLSKEELKIKLLNIQNSTKNNNLSSILLKINNFKKNKINTSYKTILISDFQNTYKNMFTNVNSDISLIKLNASNKNNISIDSIYLDNFDTENIRINVLIKNQGIAKNNIPIAFYNKNILLSKQTFSIAENTSKTLIFTTQIKQELEGKIEITYSDTFSFDNQFLFTINSIEKINILAIGSNHTFLEKIYLGKEFNFQKTSIQKINYNTLEKQELLILNEIDKIPTSLITSLMNFTKNGGNLVIIPSNNIDLDSYNLLFQNLKIGSLKNKINSSLKVTSINYNHPLLDNVFTKRVNNFEYPTVNNHYPSDLKNETTIISFENNKGFIKQTNINKSNIFLVSSSLQLKNSNFINSPLIVPIFYNFGKLSLQYPKLYYTLHKNNTIEITSQIEKNEVLTLNRESSSFIPLQQTFKNKTTITTLEQPKNSGFYTINSKTRKLSNVAYNNPKEESLLNFLDITSLNNNSKISISPSIKEVFEEINKKNEVRWLWKWFLALAIVSLLLEILILKFLKP